jgi:hypothetical protein
MIVVAVFIITAVFVGHHASQEPSEKMIEGHGKSIESNNSNQLRQTTHTLFINVNLNKI